MDDFSYQTIGGKPSVKKLLILDINGLFVHKIKKTKEHDKLKITEYCIINNNSIWNISPSTKLFINTCLEKYTVGIWSSSVETNITKFLRRVGIPHKSFLFVWSREHVLLDPYSKHSHETIKILAMLLSNPSVNENGLYTLENTVLMDDSLTKTRFNPRINTIIIEPYDLSIHDERTDTLCQRLEKSLKQAEYVFAFLENDSELQGEYSLGGFLYDYNEM